MPYPPEVAKAFADKLASRVRELLDQADEETDPAKKKTLESQANGVADAYDIIHNLDLSGIPARERGFQKKITE